MFDYVVGIKSKFNWPYLFWVQLKLKRVLVFPLKLIYILVRHRVSDVLGFIRYTFGWIAIARIHFFNTGLEKEKGLSPFGWTGKRSQRRTGMGN